MIALLAILLAGSPMTECSPMPHLVGVAPYTFEYDETGCMGKPAVAVFRLLPDFEYIEATVAEGRFSFEDEPGFYHIAVCYGNGFADLRTDLPVAAR